MIDLIDTHQHLLYRQHHGYRWSDDLPALKARDFTIDDYRDLTEELGIAASIFMEAGADDADYQAETRFVAGLAADPAHGICGLISSCRPETEAGFDAWLEECSTLDVVGFRRILHVVPDDLSETTAFRRNIRKIGNRNLVFDLCFRADQLDIARQLAKSCDNTSFVLDHCGVPDIAGSAIAPWRQHIKAIAELPHVSCKISGVLAYCADGKATIEAIRPYVAHIIDCFGPDRLIWGSDWPVVDTRSTLPDWVAIFRQLIADLTGTEQRAICNANARRIYRLA